MIKDNYQSLLKTIVSHHLPGIPRDKGMIHPHYGGYSIANLPASICRWLEIPPLLDNALAQEITNVIPPSFQHVILLLVDGLRLDNFVRGFEETLERNNNQELNHILRDSVIFPLTSISPSTTSAAITTLWTGQLPAEHGIIGYELFLKEFGVTANMIFHSISSFNNEPGSIYRSGFNPSTFLPVELIGPHFRKHGVIPYAFQHASIASSGLSRMLLKDVNSIPFENFETLRRSVKNMLLSNSQSKTYSYIYWSEFDTHSHHCGPNSKKIIEEWNRFFEGVCQIMRDIHLSGIKDTLFILTADHGQVPTEILDEYELFNHPDLLKHLILLPTGESRLPYLFIKTGHECEVQDYLKSHWQRDFSMIPSDKVLSSGLLGNAPPHQTTVDRMGSHVVFPKKNAYWWWVRKKNHLLGRHGGLSEEEMLVPFLGFQM